jgi:hypothetical protein
MRKQILYLTSKGYEWRWTSKKNESGTQVKFQTYSQQVSDCYLTLKQESNFLAIQINDQN